MEKYFVFFDGKYSYYKTKEEQSKAIDKFIDDCAEGGEWNIAVDGIFAGEVTEYTKFVKKGDREEDCINPEYDINEAGEPCPYEEDETCEWRNKGMCCDCYDPYYEVERVNI